MLVRLAIVPFLIMSGGVIIANQLGFQVGQNFNLFMAVNSIIGFPWLARTGVDLFYGHLLHAQQQKVMEQMMESMRQKDVDTLTGTQPTAAEDK